MVYITCILIVCLILIKVIFYEKGPHCEISSPLPFTLSIVSYLIVSQICVSQKMGCWPTNFRSAYHLELRAFYGGRRRKCQQYGSMVLFQHCQVGSCHQQRSSVICVILVLVNDRKCWCIFIPFRSVKWRRLRHTTIKFGAAICT